MLTQCHVKDSLFTFPTQHPLIWLSTNVTTPDQAGAFNVPIICHFHSNKVVALS